MNRNSTLVECFANKRQYILSFHLTTIIVFYWYFQRTRREYEHDCNFLGFFGIFCKCLWFMDSLIQGFEWKTLKIAKWFTIQFNQHKTPCNWFYVKSTIFGIFKRTNFCLSSLATSQWMWCRVHISQSFFFLNLFHELLRSHYSIDPKFIDDFTLTCSLKHTIFTPTCCTRLPPLWWRILHKNLMCRLFFSQNKCNRWQID